MWYLVMRPNGNWVNGHATTSPKLYRYLGTAKAIAKKLNGTLYRVHLGESAQRIGKVA